MSSAPARSIFGTVPRKKTTIRTGSGRWYFRLFIWARFRWQVSRIDLQFMATHPDRSGGLGFLGSVSYGFAPVLTAQGAMLAGMIANQIFFAGATLPEFKVEIIGLVALMVFAILGPMLVFGPKLEAAKRAGLREYGTLAQHYVREFDRKWLRGGAPAEKVPIGFIVRSGTGNVQVRCYAYAPRGLVRVSRRRRGVSTCSGQIDVSTRPGS
jgi:hypothetical protein